MRQKLKRLATLQGAEECSSEKKDRNGTNLLQLDVFEEDKNTYIITYGLIKSGDKAV